MGNLAMFGEWAKKQQDILRNRFPDGQTKCPDEDSILLVAVFHGNTALGQQIEQVNEKIKQAAENREDLSHIAYGKGNAHTTVAVMPYDDKYVGKAVDVVRKSGIYVPPLHFLAAYARDGNLITSGPPTRDFYNFAAYILEMLKRFGVDPEAIKAPWGQHSTVARACGNVKHLKELYEKIVEGWDPVASHGQLVVARAGIRKNGEIYFGFEPVDRKKHY